jgi:hypothetical protein
MKALLITVIVLLTFSSLAHANLIDNFNGTVTEVKNDGSRLMWMQDANYAQTVGLSVSGQLTWAEATSWASTLSFDGYAGWRLPTTNNNAAGSAGYNNNSEMGYLYYNELGNTAGSFVNAGPFFNIQDYWYWTGTTFVDPNFAMVFSLRDIPNSPTNEAGWEDAGTKSAVTYAWLVRDATNDTVPEPSSLYLLLFGLIAFGIFQARFSVRART